MSESYYSHTVVVCQSNLVCLLITYKQNGGHSYQTNNQVFSNTNKYDAACVACLTLDKTSILMVLVVLIAEYTTVDIGCQLEMPLAILLMGV